MNWNRVFSIAGTIALYIALSLVIILNVVKMIMPSLPQEINNGISMALVGTALIAILTQMDKMNKKEKDSINYSKQFFDGLNLITTSKTKIDTLDIMAYTTRTYSAHFRNANVYIKKVRLLVHKPKDNSLARFSTKFSVSDEILDLWKAMKREGKIGSLEIRFFEFEPTYHFAIIDNYAYHFGFYFAQEQRPGYALLTSFSANKKEDVNKCFVEDFITLFENFYTNYSYEYIHIAK